MHVCALADRVVVLSLPKGCACIWVRCVSRLMSFAYCQILCIASLAEHRIHVHFVNIFVLHAYLRVFMFQVHVVGIHLCCMFACVVHPHVFSCHSMHVYFGSILCLFCVYFGSSVVVCGAERSICTFGFVLCW